MIRQLPASYSINMTGPAQTDIPLPIVTPRLLLRLPQQGDGQYIHDAKMESWDELHKWMIWMTKPRHEASIDEDEEFCRHKREKFQSREDITLLIFDRDTGKYLGGTGLHQCDWERRFFQLGYWIRTSETGKGYATEVATALVHYAFDALSANKVTCFCAAGNDASEKVMQKAGFQKEGVLRKHHLLPDGSLVDEPTYGILSKNDAPHIDVQWG